MNQHTLVRWSFVWSEVRLIIAAVALLMGGVPPALYLFGSVPFVGALLTLCWIISGLASLYLLYQWYNNGWTVFGGHDQLDVGALVVSIVSGINLGLAPIVGHNIGMGISSAYPVFVVVAVLYVVCAVYLWRREQAVDHLFDNHG